MASIAVRACATASPEHGERPGRIVAVPDQGFQGFGRIGDRKCADRARRTLQRMRHCAGVVR